MRGRNTPQSFCGSCYRPIAAKTTKLTHQPSQQANLYISHSLSFSLSPVVPLLSLTLAPTLFPYRKTFSRGSVHFSGRMVARDKVVVTLATPCVIYNGTCFEIRPSPNPLRLLSAIYLSFSYSPLEWTVKLVTSLRMPGASLFLSIFVFLPEFDRKNPSGSLTRDRQSLLIALSR